MNKEFMEELWKAHQECPCCASPEHVEAFINDLLYVLFPEISRKKFNSIQDIGLAHNQSKVQLIQLLEESRFGTSFEKERVMRLFFSELPTIRHTLLDDAKAMYEGDPAAQSVKEVIRTYPGFYAIACYRIAHFLDVLNVKQVPRMISEYGHTKSGVEIHPNAQIGRHFSIDHGTGVVIGATATIGDHVKLYQGVTLGALSVSKEQAGIKRHPTIENNVIIYAGATILGGETIIGSDSIIGGNVWITKSVPKGSKIYYRLPNSI